MASILAKRGLILSFRQRLADLIDRHAGGNLAAFGRLCGFSGESVRQWLDESKNSRPSLDNLAAIAKACGISLDWLVLGQNQEVSLVDGGQFSFVHRYNVRASAGPGAIVVFDDLDGGAEFVAFRTEWLHRIGVNPQRAEVLISVGDSMEPTIRDGDLLLIDRSIDRVVDNGIYVFVLAGMVLVKRIQLRRDGSAVLKSDNPHYDDEAVPAHELLGLKVEGRVRWFGRTI